MGGAFIKSFWGNWCCRIWKYMRTFSFPFFCGSFSFQYSTKEHYVNPAKASHQTFSFTLSLLRPLEEAQAWVSQALAWPAWEPSPWRQAVGTQRPALLGCFPDTPSLDLLACFRHCIYTFSAAKLISTSWFPPPPVLVWYNLPFSIFSNSHLLLPWCNLRFSVI